MYQCYIVQKFNGKPYNVILGREFESINDALLTLDLYEEHFGKGIRAVIEKSGNEIPVEKEKQQTLLQKVIEFMKGVFL